ncbi:hypothetical protein GEMRC1_011952 [Eukaryota sp. GEM-RC1]
MQVVSLPSSSHPVASESEREKRLRLRALQRAQRNNNPPTSQTSSKSKHIPPPSNTISRSSLQNLTANLRPSPLDSYSNNKPLQDEPPTYPDSHHSSQSSSLSNSQSQPHSYPPITQPSVVAFSSPSTEILSRNEKSYGWCS